MPRDDDYDFDFESDDFSQRMMKQSQGGMASLNMPQGLGFYKPKKSEAFTVYIAPFVVSEAHNAFVEKLRNTKPGRVWPERTYWRHRNVGVNGDSVVCVQKTFGDRCPICEDIIRLRKSPDRDDAKLARDLRPSERQLFLVYDEDETSRGIQLWEESVHCFGKQLMDHIEGARPKDKDSYKRFWHPKDGYWIRVKPSEESIGVKEGERGGGGKYTWYNVNSFFEIDTPIPESIVKHGYDLDAMVRRLDYKTLCEIYFGTAGAADRDARGSRDRESRDDRPTRGDARPSSDREPDRNGSSRRDERDRDEAPRSRGDRDRDEKPSDKRDEAPRNRVEKKDDSAVKIASGDTVSFDDGGEKVKGKVESVEANKLTAMVVPDGRTKAKKFMIEDLTLVESDNTFDLKDAPSEETTSNRGRRSGTWDKKGAEKSAEEDKKDEPKDEEAIPRKRTGRR